MSISYPGTQAPILHGVSPEMAIGVRESVGLSSEEASFDGHALVLPSRVTGISPAQYAKLLDALGDFRLRHVYDGESLEMSPRKDHDQISRFVHELITVIKLECSIPIQSIGSTSLTKAGMEKGLEPDEAFYIANEPKVRFKRLYEPDVDPPPDLIIEIDVTSMSTKRFMMFAELGVPEVWRHVKEKFVFYQLKSSEYLAAERSHSFPF